MVDNDNNNNELDLDYVLLTAGLAGGLTAIATAATLLARPMLIELGRQLPLPTVAEVAELFAPPKQENK